MKAVMCINALKIFLAMSFIIVSSSLDNHFFGNPFRRSDDARLQVVGDATISNGALQLTPDSTGNYSLANRSGRVLFKQEVKLWEDGATRAISFNTSFLMNIFRIQNSSTVGEGLAFVIAPDMKLPENSHGGYLGLTNPTTDNVPGNKIVAIEFDSFKEDFDPDDNHMGLDIHSVISNRTVSLSQFGIELAPYVDRKQLVWIQYDGDARVISVYMAAEGEARPPAPLLSAELDLNILVKQHSYFGFAASTGSSVQLNCILSWNLSLEVQPLSTKPPSTKPLPTKPLSAKRNRAKISVTIAAGFLALVLAAAGCAGYFVTKRRIASDPTIIGRLKALPETPREFRHKDLKIATGNFDEKNKLGQGGFGVVYRGLLKKENNLQVAVKQFKRDDVNGRDDFLSELTIINCLRHKNLVRLLGWCHENRVLLLVYELMPNGSLERHLFPEKNEDGPGLEWSLRLKIISGVASALHYLHREYNKTVLHRDLKASNIMLDGEFEARLGDFGLAKTLENDGKTSYARLDGVPGTIGYIAPECFHTGQATAESDVYGFGAVVLEVVCGQRPGARVDGFLMLVDWVWQLHREGRLLEALDRRLDGEYDAGEALRLLLLALACSHPISGERPGADAIVLILSGVSPPPVVPTSKPSFMWPPLSLPDMCSDVCSDISYDDAVTPSTGCRPRFDEAV